MVPEKWFQKKISKLIKLLLVQFGSKRWPISSSLHQTSNFHEGAEGAEKQAHQILLGVEPRSNAACAEKSRQEEARS